MATENDKPPGPDEPADAEQEAPARRRRTKRQEPIKVKRTPKLRLRKARRAFRR